MTGTNDNRVAFQKMLISNYLNKEEKKYINLVKIF